jgi:uncharacterized repeat protein (TIGR01451 family)
MNKKVTIPVFVLSFLMMLTAFGITEVSAANVPDVRVLMTSPATATVNSPYIYTVNVKNVGNRTADGVKVVVSFPETDTSPQKLILGTLSGIDANRCQVVNRKLQCSLGSLAPTITKSFTFNFSLPVSNKTLQIIATGSTTTIPAETNLSNNTASAIPALAYATNQITSANILVSHCTGTTLTSYFECEQFPSSISSFTMTLDQGGIITLPYQGYTGLWDQIQTTALPNQQLHFTVTDGNSGVEFRGFATTNTCFEGMGTFMPQSNYVSPYKVCVQ